MRHAHRRPALCSAVVVALLTGACGPVRDDAPSSAIAAPARPQVAASPTSTPPDQRPLPPVMGASAPVKIEMPTIGVDSELMTLGLRGDGTMEVPPGAFPAGWFSGSPTPGERGPAVIVGHIDWVTGPGVFFRLGSLAVGDEIRVSRADGSVAVFRTLEVAQYPKDAFPSDLVYGNIDHAGLRVISCGGEFNSRTGHYEDNIVAFAELVA